MSSLRGEYGFLTIYDGITDEEAAARVNYMATVFDVREWQFYDAVEGYSAPPALGKESWQNTAFFRPVQRRLILAYVRAIRAAGGRSWLYVQAMATDPGDAELQKNAPVIGQHKVDGRPLLDVMPPTHAWAKRIAPRWATFAAEMEFSGIHWDTLGDFGAGRASRNGADLYGFLEAAKPILQAQGLEQTANFVDGFGWDERLWNSGLIAFPYWEVWSVPRVSRRFFREACPGPAGGCVFVCYPGKDSQHSHQQQNRGFVGEQPTQLLLDRWTLAKCTNHTYLAVGDGANHIQTEYFPFTRPLDIQVIEQIQSVFVGDLHKQECARLLEIYAPEKLSLLQSLPPWAPWLLLLLLLPLFCLIYFLRTKWCKKRALSSPAKLGRSAVAGSDVQLSQLRSQRS